jgi:hypothetical protein
MTRRRKKVGKSELEWKCRQEMSWQERVGRGAANPVANVMNFIQRDLIQPRGSGIIAWKTVGNSLRVIGVGLHRAKAPVLMRAERAM